MVFAEFECRGERGFCGVQEADAGRVWTDWAIDLYLCTGLSGGAWVCDLRAADVVGDVESDALGGIGMEAGAGGVVVFLDCDGDVVHGVALADAGPFEVADGK